MVDLLDKRTNVQSFNDETIDKIPFVKRMLDPTSASIEVDGEPATARTITVDNMVVPTIVERTDDEGNKRLINLEDVARNTNRPLVDVAIEEAESTGNFIRRRSPEDADKFSRLLSREAGLRRERYSLMQAGKGLGDVEMRADLEPYIQDDALTRLGYELYRRGDVDLASYSPEDDDTVIASGGRQIYGSYFSNGLPSTAVEADILGTTAPVTRSIMAASDNPIAVYENAPRALGDEFRSPDGTIYSREQAGVERDTVVHELRHAAIDWLLKNTDLKTNELFSDDKFPIKTEEYIMDRMSIETDEKGKEAKLPEFTGTRFTKDIDPEQTQRRTETIPTPPLDNYGGNVKEQRQLLDTYATDALKDFKVPEYTERNEPEPGFFQRLFGKKEGGIMMAQQGQAVLPMTQATSDPQGGGPKAANPAAKTALVPAPQQAPRPGAVDPRDEAVKIVAQDMQKAQQPAPPTMPMAPPQDMANIQMGGLAAPMNETVPMMAKGGTKEDSPDGLAVMIGLGAPAPADYEKAAEGNPPPGATKSEVADDQLVLLSEGELVVPANVVRYHGLGTYEGMRREALMGLQQMEDVGQIEYVSGGAEKADPIDENGGVIRANTGTTVLGGAPTTGLANPIASTQQAFAAPQAASAQYVSTPTTQSTLAGGQPTPTMFGKYPNMRYLFAPNVGAYQAVQNTGTQAATTPTAPTAPAAPSAPSGSSGSGGGGDDGPSPEQVEAEERRQELVQDRKSAAKDLGFTREQGIGSALLGLTPLGFMTGNPSAGTILADGTIADGNGNSFDPITGDQVGYSGGIIGNIAGALGLRGEPEPVKFAENIQDMSRALGVPDGARADADLAFERLDDRLPSEQTVAPSSQATAGTQPAPAPAQQPYQPSAADRALANQYDATPIGDTVYDFNTTPVGIAAPTVDTVFDFNTTPSGTIGTPQRADEFAGLGAPSGSPPIGRDEIQSAIRQGMERGVDGSRYPAGTTPMNPAEFAGTRSTPMDASEFVRTDMLEPFGGAGRDINTTPRGTPMDAGEFSGTPTSRQTDDVLGRGRTTTTDRARETAGTSGRTSAGTVVSDRVGGAGEHADIGNYITARDTLRDFNDDARNDIEDHGGTKSFGTNSNGTRYSENNDGTFTHEDGTTVNFTSKSGKPGNAPSVKEAEGGSDGGEPNDKVICTAMHNMAGFGTYRNKLWQAYAAKAYKNDYVQLGYHKIFADLSKKMYNNNTLANVLGYFARNRTVFIRNKIRNKPNSLGSTILWNTIEGSLYLLGAAISRGWIKKKEL